MSSDDSARKPEKPLRKPRCSKCGQVIARNPFNKCVWCGEAVPDNLKFTEEEKLALAEKQQQLKKDLIAKDIKKIKGELESSIF